MELSSAQWSCASSSWYCRDKTVWHFQKMARSFYDDVGNKRVTDVIQDPTKASLLRPVPGCPHSGRHRKGREVNHSTVLQDSEAMHTVRTAAEEALTMALKFVFEQYNKWEGGVNSSRMDKMRFHKVFRCVHGDSALHTCRIVCPRR